MSGCLSYDAQICHQDKKNENLREKLSQSSQQKQNLQVSIDLTDVWGEAPIT